MASYAYDVAEGRSYIYRVLEPERATIELRPLPTGWTVAQLYGPDNARVAPKTRKAVTTWLKGVTRERGGGAWQRHGAPVPATEAPHDVLAPPPF